MTALIFLIILLALTVGVFVVAPFVPRVDGPDKPRRYVRFMGSGLAVVFAIVFLANSMNNVSARTVGIVTEFGKATALAVAEDAEDVQQNAALADAQAATDAALADASQAADQISAQVDQLNTIAQPQA